MSISARAYRTARLWGERRTGTVARAVLADIAQQVQDHLDHGADPEYLDRLVVWMVLNQPTWQDIGLALRFAASPKPAATGRSNSSCACLGGPRTSGGAPAPAVLRQLIRRNRPCRRTPEGHAA